MGLDQYLSKKFYVKNLRHQTENIHEIIVKQGGKIRKDIHPERITYIVEEAGQWRKANQIHKWFVDNVQEGNDDCGEYYVTAEQLQTLLDVCKQVQDKPSLAPQLLPTQGGFFFGGEEYNEWYFENIADTIAILEKTLKENVSASYCYSSSW